MTDSLVRAATLADASIFAPLLRKADVDECLALGFASGLEALEVSLAATMHPWAAYLGGQPAGLFGIAGQGRIWLLTCESVNRYPIAFFKLTRRCLKALLDAHDDVVYNWVDARYTQSLAWLEHLGFGVCVPYQHGPRDMLFHFVYRRP